MHLIQKMWCAALLVSVSSALQASVVLRQEDPQKCFLRRAIDEDDQIRLQHSLKAPESILACQIRHFELMLAGERWYVKDHLLDNNYQFFPYFQPVPQPSPYFILTGYVKMIEKEDVTTSFLMTSPRKGKKHLKGKRISLKNIEKSEIIIFDIPHTFYVPRFQEKLPPPLTENMQYQSAFESEEESLT